MRLLSSYSPRYPSVLPVLSLGLLLALGTVAAPADAQRQVEFNSLSEGSPAAVSCGFCETEKFGTIFREFSPGRGLLADSFPLTVQSLEVTLAAATVGDDLSCAGGSTASEVNVAVEVYSGVDAPTGGITNNPSTGPWPGETLVYENPSQALTLSVVVTSGGSDYDVMFNTIELPGEGVLVPAPNTYIRVSVSIPGGGMNASCEFNGFGEPAGYGLRDDDGVVAANTSFIYALETPAIEIPPFISIPGTPAGWHWNEGAPQPINGDWGLRLNVLPQLLGGDAGPSGSTDAGPSGGADAGTSTGADAGMGAGTGDAGTIAAMDGAVSSGVDAGPPGPSCSADSQCGGGQRCVDGACRMVACVAAADCAGGMNCVEGVCRNLCTSNAECMGGEVCEVSSGNCMPVGTGGTGGGCSVAHTEGSHQGATLVLFGLMLLGGLIRRRRA